MATLRDLTGEQLTELWQEFKADPALKAAFAARLWRELEARDAQRPPQGEWHTWLLLGGRGTGKTTAGARTWAERIRNGTTTRLALIERTPADARETMIEGDDGILSASLQIGMRPNYEPAKKRIRWPNHALARVFTAAEPDSVRGFNSDGVWAEELCAWRAPETWANAMLGLRLGAAQAIVTTTPKATPLLREIMAAPGTVITKMRTLENRDNLSPAFIRYVVEPLLGTRMGRQELDAEVLLDAAGALWLRDQLEQDRVKREQVPELAEVAVAIDPAVTAEPGSNETGIVGGGRTAGSVRYRRGYLLADRSGVYTVERWARIAVDLYHELEADWIVAEANQGGDLVRSVIQQADPSIKIKLVWASRGKATRAQPVAQLCEQHRISHAGVFPELEDQLCLWEPGVSMGYSPDRLDAYVWLWSQLIPAQQGFSIDDAIRMNQGVVQ